MLTLFKQVRAAEAKINFPSRHDWDSYFRDAKNMNEMRPGERPDTIHIKVLQQKDVRNNNNIITSTNNENSIL